MKFYFSVLSLLLGFAPLAFSQLIDRAEHDCNAPYVLTAYLSQDSIQSIEDPEILYDVASIAYNANNTELCKAFLKRIIENKEANNTLIAYQAKLSQYFLFGSGVELEALRQVIRQQYGQDHELMSVIDLVEADHKIRARASVAVDSIIPLAISRIKNLKRYRNFISVSYQNLSKYYAAKGKIKESLRVAHQLKAFVRRYFPQCSNQLSGTYVTLGRRQLDNGAMDSASYYFQLAHDLNKRYHPKDYNLLSESAENIADALRQKGLFANAIQTLEEAKTYAEKDESSDSELPNIYNAMGLNYRDSGNRNKAIEYFRKSIRSAEKQSSDPTVRKLAAYFNMGVQLFHLDDYVSAEKYYNKALELCLQIVGENHAYTASVLMSLGSLHSHLKQYDEWAKYFERSLKIRKHLYKKNHSSISNIYLNYALVYLELEDAEKAASYVNKAIEGYEAHVGKIHPRLADAYLKKARIDFFNEKYVAAYVALDNSKKALGYEGAFKSSSDPILYMDIVKTEAIFKLLDFKRNNNGSLDSIITTFGHALEVFQYNLEFSERISDRSTLSSEYNSLFDYYSEALVLQGEATGEESLFYQAYIINDIGKNLGLNEALNQRTQLLFSNVPKEKRARLKNLKGQIKLIDHQLSALDLNDEITQGLLLDSLLDLQIDFSDLKRNLQVDYPAYSQIQNASNGLNFETLIPESGSGLAIVDFRILDSTLISFVFSNDQLKVKRQKIDPQFPEQLTQYLKTISRLESITDASNDMLRPLVHALSDLDPDIYQLVIIPDKFLSNFPFEILEIEQTPLINQYAISYANSASILDLQSAMPIPSNEYAFAGFAPDYSTPLDTTTTKMYAAMVRAGNWDLPFAKEEVAYVTDLLPRSKQYLGDHASKENLLKAIKESTIVHLSMHAEVNIESPMNSRFIFNTKEEKEANDLLLYELYNMNATTQMVVLSACETGIGTFHSGDGVRSLGNGFLYAGVPSVLMTLWKVPDESTSLIMKSFYNFLKEGKSKSDALRLAKLDYLENVMAPEQKHPYYWAGFILSGNDDPITFQYPFWDLKIIIPALMLLFFSIWFFKRRT